jgi:hypothetical protein
MRFTFVSVLLLCAACSKPGTSDRLSNDSTAVDTAYVSIDQLAPVEAPAPDTTHIQVEIGFDWPGSYNIPQQFQPFNKVYDQAALVRHVIDSVLNATHGEYNDSDSVLFIPAEDRAYQAILAYEEQLRSGIKVERGKAPDRSNGHLTARDESLEYLPESASTLLNDIDFMFLGGGPFISLDDELYKDLDGNPEGHYTTDTPQNSKYFFNYVYSRHAGPIELTYGGSLSTYDGPDIEVHGIGSIVHHLKDRIPVWFITTIGGVQGSLVSVEMNIGEEYGCKTNYPAYVFACPKNIDPRSIFGVFYSDIELQVDKTTSYYNANSPVWSIDINGDMQPDIVRIQSTYAGASSNDLAVAIWFAYINNKWVVIDYATDPDCT